MEIFSTLLDICAGNSPVTGEFSPQRLVTLSFDIFFDLRLNKQLCKQSWGWWFDTLPCPLWCHCNDVFYASKSIKNNIDIWKSHGGHLDLNMPSYRYMTSHYTDKAVSRSSYLYDGIPCLEAIMSWCAWMSGYSVTVAWGNVLLLKWKPVCCKEYQKPLLVHFLAVLVCGLH